MPYILAARRALHSAHTVLAAANLQGASEPRSRPRDVNKLPTQHKKTGEHLLKTVGSSPSLAEMLGRSCRSRCEWKFMRSLSPYAPTGKQKNQYPVKGQCLWTDFLSPIPFRSLSYFQLYNPFIFKISTLWAVPEEQ